jgi:8-oxo-dGTP diphosphatase
MTVIDKIAWIRLEDGAILSSRSRGKDVYYLPGGKREPGEGDIDTLVREVQEELSVAIIPDSAQHVGVFQAQAHGHPDGTIVRRTCYTTADYQGTLQPDSQSAGGQPWPSAGPRPDVRRPVRPGQRIPGPIAAGHGRRSRSAYRNGRAVAAPGFG